MAKDGKPRRRKWIVVFLILAVVVGVVWYGKNDHEEAPQYQTATVTRGDLTQVVTASGTLNPVVNVQVGSQVSGNIQKLYADFNSRRSIRSSSDRHANHRGCIFVQCRGRDIFRFLSCPQSCCARPD